MLVRKALPQPAIRRVILTDGGPLPLAQVRPPALPVLHTAGILVQPACFAIRHGALSFWLAFVKTFRSHSLSLPSRSAEATGRADRGSRLQGTCLRTRRGRHCRCG